MKIKISIFAFLILLVSCGQSNSENNKEQNSVPLQKNKSATTEKIEFTPLVDLENAIKIGKENKNNVLIYFTCYACVSSRKLEDNILTNSQVKSLLTENFSFFIAYLDDNTIDKSTNSTVGEKFMKLQKDTFKSTFQPYFYIIDYNGKVLSEISYTNDKEAFIAFLEKGMK
jgi:thioredoxin-related protein